MGLAAVEIAKMLLSAYFSFAKLQGATDDELRDIYNEARTTFDQNTPNQLEDV